MTLPVLDEIARTTVRGCVLVGRFDAGENSSTYARARAGPLLAGAQTKCCATWTLRTYEASTDRTLAVATHDPYPGKGYEARVDCRPHVRRVSQALAPGVECEVHRKLDGRAPPSITVEIAPLMGVAQCKRAHFTLDGSGKLRVQMSAFPHLPFGKRRFGAAKADREADQLVERALATVRESYLPDR
jgi:hypothetical protein